MPQSILQTGLRTFAYSLLGILIFLAFFILPWLVLGTAAGIGELVLPWLMLACSFTLGICILILLPMSLFYKTREVAGVLFYLVSYVFGITAWLFGLVLTFNLWGVIAVIIGIFILGVGVVMTGILAAAFNGLWLEFTILLAASLLTFATRMFGLRLIEEA